MKTFNGFPDGKVRLVPVPAPFFSELLPELDHLAELKLVLYFLWRLDRMEGTFRYLSRADFVEDELFMKGLAAQISDAETVLDEALERAVLHAVLLKADLIDGDTRQALYFLNSPKGRAAVEAIRQGKWRSTGDPRQPVSLIQERPNIFRLYEENIGPLTPMIADTLRDAERDYPADWIEDALRIAVNNNVRRWVYVEAILRSWKEEGRDEQNRRESQKDYGKYLEGEFSEFIKH
jgi:DnaD/phage-associated family protein